MRVKFENLPVPFVAGKPSVRYSSARVCGKLCFLRGIVLQVLDQCLLFLNEGTGTLVDL